MTKTGRSSNIFCFESQTFYAVIEEVVERIKDKISVQFERWIGDEEAMKMLRINSKTTLQKYWDEGKIRYSQPSRKVILNDRQSIFDFIEQHAKETF